MNTRDDSTALSAFEVSRQGYSDRISHLMARLSQLAYLKFEEVEQEVVDQLLERIHNEPDKAGNLLKVALQPGTAAPGSDKSKLADKLQSLGFELVQTFCHKGTDTQAYVAKMVDHPSGPPLAKIAVLSFRGSEKEIGDWATNLSIGDIRMKDRDEEFQVHEGFLCAFKSIQPLVEQSLKPLIDDGYKLYITGHSLGGALAVIATHQIARIDVAYSPHHTIDKQLNYDSLIPCGRICACYTFGSPRVAGIGFGQSIKTPIYRVVNADDIVPRVPPVYLPWLLRVLSDKIPLLRVRVPYLREGLIWILGLLSKIPGSSGASFRLTKEVLTISESFIHHGDMRYICPAESGGQVKVLSNPGLNVRIRFFLMHSFNNMRNVVKDHNIGNYESLLGDYVNRRNKVDS